MNSDVRTVISSFHELVEWESCLSSCFLQEDDRLVFEVSDYISTISKYIHLIPEAFSNEIIPPSKRDEGTVVEQQDVCLQLTNLVGISKNVRDCISEFIAPRVTQLVIRNCDQLDWTSDVKKLFSSAHKIKSLTFIKNKWITDSIIEQFSIRFHDALICIHFERYFICFMK